MLEGVVKTTAFLTVTAGSLALGAAVVDVKSRSWREAPGDKHLNYIETEKFKAER